MNNSEQRGGGQTEVRVDQIIRQKQRIIIVLQDSILQQLLQYYNNALINNEVLIICHITRSRAKFSICLDNFLNSI